MFAENESFFTSDSSIGEIQEKYWNRIRHPYVGGMELTPYCNLSCVHCYLQDQNKSKLLSTNQIKTIIDKLFNTGVLFLYFTGGEILTRPDFLDIYVYAKQKGFIIELLTNGTVMTQKEVDVFNKYHPASISISMYGKDEESYFKVTGAKGMYSKVINTFNLLHENHIHFEIKYIGMKENEDDFFEIKSVAESYKATFSHSMELFPTLNGNNCTKQHMMSLEKIIEIESRYDKKYLENKKLSQIPNPFIGREEIPLYLCDMAVSNFLIDYQGYINPCHKARIKKWNLLDCDFNDAWNDYGSLRKEKASKSNKCLKCDYLMMCSPCILVNFLSTGDYNKPSETVCKLTHMRVESIKSY